ncbi:uracil-DNA glycosylase [Hoyosella sp. G463]|uniref:Type-5 uracil-DNA glycosylase n=1 Tax=Lolliginicoccus lacisalsi TaxID=2742202 RepID=A0A927JAU2_9ACTN|nr:uracil-DNA glycosylase [Lolliginicoccus lacisalsi]MBD8505017.1 uracil-DNA glycosylase [Lolliginicoccus lacisalsi]
MASRSTPAGPEGAGDPGTAPDRAQQARSLDELDALIASCRACPRLVAWREEVGRDKPPRYRDWDYWARAVPGFGDPAASIAVVGLAPAAHGANRTGRLFTGDQSGDFLFASMHRAGLASQGWARDADDGLELHGARLVAPVHCAPPANKPTPSERDRCGAYLSRELELLAPTLRVAVVLGGFGWQALLARLVADGWKVPRPRPRFGHGAEITVDHTDGRSLTLVGCFHPSQHNTFTGRLTPAMLDTIFLRARDLCAA